jgi:hypothetical protein
MTRVCPVCQLEFSHEAVTADGARENTVRMHLIVCSWVCLIEEIGIQGLVPKESE